MLQQSDSNQGRSHRRETSHDGERLGGFSSFESRVVEIVGGKMQYTGGKCQHRSAERWPVKAKGNQQQAEDADEAEPEHKRKQVGGFGAAEQHLVPYKRYSDERMGNNGDEYTVMKERKVHVAARAPMLRVGMADRRCFGYGSAVKVSTTSRSRGPSSSMSTTRCQVPSSNWPFCAGSVTEVPIRAERM